ncbi:MAG: PQQ-dependent dehydrogenase, methanol/ethanol family [Pseudomonadota bacterium]
MKSCCLYSAISLLLVASIPVVGGEVDHERLSGADRDPGVWLTHGRNYAETRESPLARITADNVAQLGLAWSFDTATTRGLEATPLVVDGVMYTSLSWSEVIANDARTGKLLWRFDPKVPRAWGANACCDVVNRGVAAWDDMVYVGTLDGRLIGLDRATGSVRWEVLTIDPERPYTITGAPRVVRGNVIIGNGGAEFGVRGYVSAYDAKTGKLAWRFYTVPGAPDQPYESQALAMAARTWTGDVYWKSGGGGTVWDSMAYDPQLDLLYIGVGNGSPWNRWLRSPEGGDNLFLSSIVALDAQSGEYRWHYQTTPSDTWDFTATQHMILADIEIRGKMRQVLMQAPKNGFFYVLDRATGELLAADNYVPVTWASHVDLESGRPVETENADHSAQPQETSPAALGGHSWQPMAYNQSTGLVYIPAMEMAQIYSSADSYEHQPGHHWNLGQGDPDDTFAILSSLPDALTKSVFRHLLRGKLIAWDPVLQEQRWSVQHQGMWNGGVLTTAGGLVFQGNGSRQLVAYDAADGTRLWSADTGSGIVAAPISYEIDGEQYVAILAGWGGIGGLMAPQYTPVTGVNRLLVYKLGGTATLPADEPYQRVMTQAPPPPPRDAASVDRGVILYQNHCQRCHGINVGLGGVIADLRFMSQGTHQIFDRIVLEGIYSGLGMVSFADVLDQGEAEDIHNYLIEQANLAWDVQHRGDGWWAQMTDGVLEFVGDMVGAWLGPERAD